MMSTPSMFSSIPIPETNSSSREGSLHSSNNGNAGNSAATGRKNMHIRRLYSRTILLQDWDQIEKTNHGHNTSDHEMNNTSASYWELFIDLLLVAAASSIADTYRDTQNIYQFVLSYLIIINGWFLYSYHISTRFENSAFLTSIIFFIYLLGFGWTTANIRDFSNITFDVRSTTTTDSYNTEANDKATTNQETSAVDSETVQEFIVGAMVLQCSILIMCSEIATTLPRARYFCSFMATNVGLTLLSLIVAYIGTSLHNTTIIHIGLWMAALTELLFEVLISGFVNIKRFIPINIEQSQERFNALGLVMLGETVVSITQVYREITSSNEVKQNNDVQVQYYEVLGLSLLLIFMITLSLFHTSPPPEEHALRRSKLHAVTLMMVQKVIGLPLLAVGVSVKLIVEAVMKQEELSLFGYQCMSYGVGLTLISNHIIRLLHHAGKTEMTLYNNTSTIHENKSLHFMIRAWWCSNFILSCLPFVWYLMRITTRDPVTAILYHAILVFGMNFVESAYIHIILALVSTNNSTAMSGGERNSQNATSNEAMNNGERALLLSSHI